MRNKQSIETEEAKYGEKMIEVKVRFWTNDLTDSANEVIPKHGWTSGVVRIERNKSHGIVPGKPVIFNSLLDLGSAIERVLKKNEIVLHVSSGMRHYVAETNTKSRKK